MTRRILLLGRNGQVGFELARSLLPLGEVIATERSSLDLADADAIRALVRRIRPNLIVNAAAYTAVDRAESDADTAFAINATAPAVLAQQAVEQRAWLIHYSTDYVFGGDKPAQEGAYLETDPTGPLNVYGRSKLAGEDAIRASGARHIILRTSWVYGRHGNNFLKTILHLARERERLTIVADQFGVPTSARVIADTTALIVSRLPHTGDTGAESERQADLLCGVYHLQCAGRTTWHGYACAIVERLRAADPEGIRCRSVDPIATADYPTAARRPANAQLDCTKLATTFNVHLPPWPLALARCIDELPGLVGHLSGLRGGAER